VHTGEQLQFLMLSLYLLHVYRLGIPLARLRNYLPLRGYHHSGSEKKRFKWKSEWQSYFSVKKVNMLCQS